MQLSWAITLQISRVKPGNPRREGGKKGGRDEREGGRNGREEGTYGREGRGVIAIMKRVHMAWNGCLIGKCCYKASI